MRDELKYNYFLKKKNQIYFGDGHSFKKLKNKYRD